jgi:hypothetical protein
MYSFNANLFKTLVYWLVSDMFVCLQVWLLAVVRCLLRSTAQLTHTDCFLNSSYNYAQYICQQRDRAKKCSKHHRDTTVVHALAYVISYIMLIYAHSV